LGSGPIPSKQIAFGSKDSPLVSFFGISQVNSNDLFFAQVDQNTRTGTVWLTSPSGKLRGAILTSTNGAPKTLATEGQEESYQELRAEFFSASEPPP
jgi:hypothetical protein